MDELKSPYPRPIVSVILPTFNRAASLERAIRCVLAQTFSDFELIVIDDGSTDGTPQIVKTINDRRLHFLRLPVNRGAAAARNLGIKESHAGLIAFQDSDDIWSPDKLAVQIESIKQINPKTGVLYSSFRWQSGQRQGITPANTRTVLSRFGLARHRLEGDLRQALLRGNFITTQTALVKRECLDSAGGFDKRLARLQDWDLWLRIAQHYQFHYIDRPLVRTYRSSKRISADENALLRAFDLLLSKHRHDKQAYNEISAQRCYALGSLYMRKNRPSPARNHLWRALRQSPLTAVYWLAALASLFGPKFYRRTTTLVGSGY
ncbi:glycosyltransferase family 2 protein [Chloroflexota bacterium]